MSPRRAHAGPAMARTLAAAVRCLFFGALILFAWLDWISATPTPLPIALAVSWWGLRGIVKALAP